MYFNILIGKNIIDIFFILREIICYIFWMIFSPKKQGICNFISWAFSPNFTPKKEGWQNPQREEENSS